MNNIDNQYLNLIRDILNNGVEKEDRTGTGTLSVFGRQIRHKMSEGFPLLTTKKLSFKNIWTELVWFLSGDTNIKYLLENGNYIWVGDAYRAFHNAFPKAPMMSREDYINSVLSDEGFAKEWGNLGKIYGHNWRNFAGRVDQVKNVIELLMTDPDSRRMLVSAWNPSEHGECILPPCHYSWQVYTRELSWTERREIFQPMVDGILTEKWANEIGFAKRAISLMWSQRSTDTPLGLPYNIASYGLLLQMLADEVNMIPEELIGNLGDTHIYTNQIDGVKEQLLREPMPLPTLNIKNGIRASQASDFELIGYNSHPAIKMPLSN